MLDLPKFPYGFFLWLDFATYHPSDQFALTLATQLFVIHLNTQMS